MSITFATTTAWDRVDGYGCASLGLAGVCENAAEKTVSFRVSPQCAVLTGSYREILESAAAFPSAVRAAIVLFGNAGGENRFLQELYRVFACPMVGGGAAIDPQTGRSALITGGGEAAVCLLTDDAYSYVTETKCVHTNVLKTCSVSFADPRIVDRIDGIPAAEFLADQRKALGLGENDFEHLTLSDLRNVNAHLSEKNGLICSGRDLRSEMLLRYVSPEEVYGPMAEFYNDPDAIIFGCAGLAGILPRPIEVCPGVGLFLFGEVCTVDGLPEFGNLMLSKLRILPR